MPVIRGLEIMEVSIGAIVVTDSEVGIFVVDNLNVHPISLRVNLVDLFWQIFTLLMEVSLVVVITHVRESRLVIAY